MEKLTILAAIMITVMNFNASLEREKYTGRFSDFITLIVFLTSVVCMLVLVFSFWKG